MTYIELYKLCEKHNIDLIEEYGWLKFYYQRKKCGQVSTNTEHEQKVVWAGAKKRCGCQFHEDVGAYYFSKTRSKIKELGE